MITRLLSVFLSLLLNAGQTASYAASLSYECWIDHDISLKETGTVAGNTLTQTIPVEGLSPGVHWINYRLTDDAGNSGGIYRKHFIVLPTESNAAEWRYWLDEYMAGMVSGTVTSATHAVDINVAGFTPGVHFFSYQYGNGSGQWGGIYRKHFMVLPNETKATKCQYWIDNDKGGIQTDTVTSTVQTITLDLAGLPPGPHFFNYRYCLGSDGWGAVYRKLFVIKGSGGANIKGYRHYLNGKSLGYVEQATPTTDSCLILADIPKDVLAQLDRSPLEFSGDVVLMERSGIVNYRLQLQSEYGWGSLSEWDLDISDTFSTTAVAMAEETSRTFDVPFDGEFAAVRFTSAGKPLYFRSDVPVALDIYRDGILIKEIPPSQLTSSAEVALDAGEYFGILHDAESDSSGTFTLALNASKEAGITYDGRYLRFKAEDSDAVIRYSFSGIAGLTEEQKYDGIPVDVSTLPSDKSFTVSAKVEKGGIIYSTPVTYRVEYCGGDEKAWTTSPGQLSKGYEWNDGKSDSERLTVAGSMGAADYEWLRQCSRVKYLDISEVESQSPTGAGNVLERGALAIRSLVTLAVPKGLVQCADSVFGSIPTLCAVFLPEGNDTPETLIGGVSNPNLIVYNRNAQTFSDSIAKRIINVIDGEANGVVVLHDGYPFYSPEEFRVSEVRFSKEFRNETGYGSQSAGWESIVVPFAVQDIEHERGHRLMPFEIWDEADESERPFWLYSASSDDWHTESSLEADTPYIISMPNNPEYIFDYNVNGTVTFSAQDVTLGPEVSIPSTTEWKDGMVFSGTFMPTEESDILSLNTGGEGGMLPGSVFIAEARTLPFGAYVSQAGSRRMVPVFGESGVIGLPTVTDFGIAIDSSVPGTIRISSVRDCGVTVCSVEGAVVARLRISAGESRTVDGLSKGVYIVAGQKIMVK